LRPKKLQDKTGEGKGCRGHLLAQAVGPTVLAGARKLQAVLCQACPAGA